MVKCPFCQFDNEEGALFCEQCKSDLASVPATPAPAPPPPMPEPVPMAAIMEDSTIPMATPIADPGPAIPVVGLEPTIPIAAVSAPAPVPMPAPTPAPAPTPPPAAAAPAAPTPPPAPAPAPTP